ncbi:hypothetical protein MAPG_10603 [Magnaporthiopsis poae ATCC 64411]|uniref:Uncharacterized protein n=1 Tax=Magnaporthiopsis poae (strain ATCC 64411 / 73-15) TaxID=644358 RepID=A0A0C4ED12_MAGP6|nr:hypothetical protein MAPG_10603 [Magnaporthiopsis poae ATCC 64411]
MQPAGAARPDQSSEEAASRREADNVGSPPCQPQHREPMLPPAVVALSFPVSVGTKRLNTPARGQPGKAPSTYRVIFGLTHDELLAKKKLFRHPPHPSKASLRRLLFTPSLSSLRSFEFPPEYSLLAPRSALETALAGLIQDQPSNISPDTGQPSNGCANITYTDTGQPSNISPDGILEPIDLQPHRHTETWFSISVSRRVANNHYAGTKTNLPSIVASSEMHIGQSRV